MIYCDTSIMVAALLPDEASGTVQRWLGAQGPGQLCVSGWVEAELSGVLAAMLAQGALDFDQRADVLAHWNVLARECLIAAPVQPQAWALAARFADRHDLGLRAGDALHLAVAQLGGHSLATLDLWLADAALAVGVVLEGI